MSDKDWGNGLLVKLGFRLRAKLI